MENQHRYGFVQSRLPWLIALGALILYLITLNRWVSLASLSMAGLVTDPEATLPLNGPLHYLLACVFRWLPAGWQLVGLNLIAGVCAALTLALLARSVALLPHDRTREQRQRERNEFSLLSIPAAWAPPLLAALVCGLQLSFWEHATAYTGEMLDLLLFAYVVRCLLEYRVDQRESWLTRLALVYGVATANNHAMIAYFPAFLAALIWIKGFSFFDFHFLTRLVGFGTLGLTLYLVLPLASALADNAAGDFWTTLRFQLVGQKNSLLGFDRFVLFCAALTSLLPILLIGIRWPASFGDTSAAGSILTNVMFRVVHAVLFAVCLWVSFDYLFSPRVILESRLLRYGVEVADEAVGRIALLSLYYLSALCIGYFAGYFLLVFGHDVTRAWQRVSSAKRLFNRLVAAAVWVAIIVVPAGLLYRNFHAARVNNGTLLREYAAWLVEGLPKRGAIALSDTDPVLSLVQASVNQSGSEAEHLLVDTRKLPYPVYQRSLHRRFPKRWPALPTSERPVNYLDSPYRIALIASLTQSNDTYYLHPSFGYFFEPLYLQPRGLIYKLGLYATNAVTPPPLSAEVVDENRKFWNRIEPAFDRISTLSRQNVRDARLVGRWLSRSLNYWGVEIQQGGRLEEAERLFEQARRLNRENVAAEINLNLNQSLRTGKTKSIEFNKSIEDMFDRYRGWDPILAANGPIDDPAFRYQLGQTLAQQSLFRQAALQFIRVQELEPGNLDNRFWLANMYLIGQVHDKVLETTQAIRARQAKQPLSVTNQVELVRLEATARFGKGETNAAEKLLLDARKRLPENNVLLDGLVQLYLVSNRATDALAAVDDQLRLLPGDSRLLLLKTMLFMKMKDYERANTVLNEVLRKEPSNPHALLNLGALRIETGAYQDALQPLNQLLKLQPDNQLALMNRAIAHLQTDQLDAARRDYERLLNDLPYTHRFHFGLAEIAYRQKDTATAIKHYEAYLQYAPSDTQESKEYKSVTERLKELKASGR